MHLLLTARDNVTLNEIIGNPTVLQDHLHSIGIHAARTCYMTSLVMWHYVPDSLQQRKDNIFFASFIDNRIEHFLKRRKGVKVEGM